MQRGRWVFFDLVCGLMNCKSGRKLEESSFCHFSMWEYTRLILWFSCSLCRICWRAYLLYFKRPWKPSLRSVQPFRLASSCYHLQEAACLSSRHNCLTLVQGPCSPGKTPTKGHRRRWERSWLPDSTHKELFSLWQHLKIQLPYFSASCSLLVCFFRTYSTYPQQQTSTRSWLLTALASRWQLTCSCWAHSTVTWLRWVSPSRERQ